MSIKYILDFMFQNKTPIRCFTKDSQLCVSIEDVKILIGENQEQACAIGTDFESACQNLTDNINGKIIKFKDAVFMAPI